MKRLEDSFEALAARAEGAFMPFLVIGDPGVDTSLSLAASLVRGGADILEFGLAFSDPPADGPTIQAAGKRALAAGIRTDQAFDYLARVRNATALPIALLVYYNLVFCRGLFEFCRRAKEAGVDAILIADLPIEESDLAIAAMEKNDIAPIFIVSELTREERLRWILERARGYVYLVARIGVTGQSNRLSMALRDVIAGIRASSAIRIMAGFGISTPAHVKAVLEAGADGAISGSAVVRRIEDNLGDPERMAAVVEEFCREMKAATRRSARGET